MSIADAMEQLAQLMDTDANAAADTTETKSEPGAPISTAAEAKA
jgi:hypothetical protein